MEIIGKIERSLENRRARHLVRSAGDRPIYHIHVRKTGGTTINFAFLTLSGRPDTTVFYEQMAEKANHRTISNGRVFVGWNPALINEGWYTYGFSHIPMHKIDLQRDPYLITCLRDPVERVLSHYAMLLHFQTNGVKHPCMETEGPWLGASFDDFLNNLPKEHLMNQLYMFSADYNVEDAVGRLRKVDKVLYTADLNQQLRELSSELGFQLPISNQKTFNVRPNFEPEQQLRLREMLDAEYQMLDALRGTKQGSE
ncbi:MAG: sulfotransferase family 2 domain-containing protein [Cryomorphaceae bacterium]